MPKYIASFYSRYGHSFSLYFFYYFRGQVLVNYDRFSTGKSFSMAGHKLEKLVNIRETENMLRRIRYNFLYRKLRTFLAKILANIHKIYSDHGGVMLNKSMELVLWYDWKNRVER